MYSQSYRILLVENDPAQAEHLSATLEDAVDVFQVVHARSLEAGLAVLCTESIDALLLEEGALEDGVASVGKIHARFESLPIVVIVPREKENLRKSFLQAGASDVLGNADLGGTLLKKAIKYAVGRGQSESLLRQSEERFQELFENAKDIIFTLDLEGNFKSLNKSAEEVMGWSREEVQSINLKKIVAPEHLNLCKQLMSHLLNEEQLQQFEINLLRKDGKKVVLEACARLIHSEGKKKGIQGIARDVTERRNLEHMVRQSQKLDAIGRLSGGLAHDFNNLLCVISGHAELLTEQLSPEDPSIRNVAQIKKAADSASSLVRQLLAFSRKQVFHPQILDLNGVVAETEKLLGRLIGEHVEFCMALQPTLGRVCVDPVQIEQVIVNLVLNARDAMAQGGKLTLETRNVDVDKDSRSRHAIIPAGKYVVLAVTDNGSGMDEETQNRIFEPFYTTKEPGKGTGLGLSTVYGIVKQSGGSVAVCSEPGQGTTFRVYLPRVDATAAVKLSGESAQEREKGTETILLVENSEPLRALAKEFLRSSGYAVLDAENGRDAIRIAKAFGGQIHLLLTDVIMPGMGGKQLAEQFATLRPATKVLYMSGYSDEGIVRSGVLNAKSNFLEKPFTRDMLLRRVRLVLDQGTRLLESSSVKTAPAELRSPDSGCE
ncbi:MAG TPA: PAS domain S-box protein [Candidatus Angelobacter sp.]|nr:PAS domain S-box protein [Candidatus Angelobacter sp.]